MIAMKKNNTTIKFPVITDKPVIFETSDPKSHKAKG
jgi:hypothetical protein